MEHVSDSRENGIRGMRGDDINDINDCGLIKIP